MLYMRNFFLILFPAFFLESIPSSSFKTYHINGYAQGTTYQITYFATDGIVTKIQIDSVLDKIDSSLSLYKPYSIINKFNQSERGVMIDKYFSDVLDKSIEVYNDTKGLFDITVQPLVQAWGFGAMPSETLPEKKEIRKIKKCVDTYLLKIENQYLFKKKPCVAIDMNGIAQGYSVDVLAGQLERNGIVNYMVELGGEIRLKGRKQPSGEKFKVGIESPAEDEFENNKMQKILLPDSGAITTSGSYRKYYESSGRRVTHIINPITGYPVQNELISVTVYAKDAITADGYDNALMLMGLKKALTFTEKRKELAAYFIYKKKDGTVADTASSRFYKLINH